ncbi:MAG: helix-turn-helix transcriptional regulator, partial [Zavarzinia sp.]|nr:helix-turn-helix transcriptional regulator [Zavarzinia sp.]
VPADRLGIYRGVRVMSRRECVDLLLRAWRAERGLTQAQAADVLGMPLRTYHGFEGGRTCSYAGVLRKLISLL